jgi:hypothetical protein
MKATTQFRLVTVSRILLVACTAVSVHAQRNLNRPAPSPTPGPTITKVPGPVLTRDRTGTQLPPGISATIRWSKELGLPYDPSSDRMAHHICSIFRPTLSFRDSASGPPHLLRGLSVAGSNPTDVDGYYTCNYVRPVQADLPSNLPLTVTLDFDSRVPDTASREWFVGSNTKPPPGQQRVIIIIGGQPNTFTLSDDQPRAVVNFEMVYGPTPQPPGKP